MLISAQTVTIGTGTTTTCYNPLYSWYGYNYTQQIYTAAEISAGGVSAGDQITQIRFYWAGTGNLTNADTWVVYLGNTAQATFGTTTNWVPLASMTQVYNGSVASAWRCRLDDNYLINTVHLDWE
jgi:large repetitive protein